MASAAAMPLVVEDLVVRLGGREVLSHVSFHLLPGRRAVVLGPNGAGKSVLLRTLHGLIVPAAGRIRWGGDRPRQAMVFQRPVMLRRSARANVEYALAIDRVGGSERDRRTQQALERVGLGAQADRPARILSGGEQQRLALARAWALRPQALFLDEPTASLDPAATTEIEGIVQGIHAEGARIVMTTHNLGQARRLADDIVLVHGGRVTEVTPADEFFNAPRSPEGAAFLQGELPWK